MIHLDISLQDYDAAIHMLQKYSSHMDALDMSIDFGADHAQSKIIRDFVGSIFDTHSILPPWKGRFVLITDELINNAIEHGSQEGDTDTCIIRAGTKKNGQFYITLEVHDTGNGKDSEKAKDMIQVKEDHSHDMEKDGVYMEKRGRGLFHITEKLVDRLEFTKSPKGGLAVKIEKNIPRSE